MVDANVSFTQVRASRGKAVRAEPVAALYEQGKIHHVGTFAELEDQLCGWTPDSGDSPDRLDALVWAFTELMVMNTTPDWGYDLA
jgi:phage terminase large subunit-like protein